MGNCVGGTNAESTVFKVININDTKSLVQRGLMEVTTSELVYVDRKSKEEWHWPLKFLRKYGCDGDVFTFEAGRKCPGGEGLYAFSTSKANILFDMVARNINQGDMSPLPPEPQALEMTFPPRRTLSASPPPREQPSYTNLDLMGNPLDSPLPEAVTPPDPTQYREVVFDRPPEEHPKPLVTPRQTVPSYTQIDFDKTAERAAGLLPSISSTTPHPRTSSTSTSGGGISPTKRARRTRVHTYSGHDRQVSRSESSFSSQSSLTESSRDVLSPLKPNGATPQTKTSDNAPSTYQNVQLALEQLQYQNVQVGAGEVNQVFEPHQQPNYCNVSLSASGGGASAVPGPTENGRVGPGRHVIKVSGEMTTYAQLELSHERKSTRTMSSSGGDSSGGGVDEHYPQLDFPAGGGEHHSAAPGEGGVAAHRAVNGRRCASVSGPLPPTSSGGVASTGLAQQNIPEEESAARPAPQALLDETKVTYGVLSFKQMDVLTKLRLEHEQDVESETLRREERDKERERANTHNSRRRGN